MSLLRLRPAGVRGRLAGEAPFPRPDHGGAPALEADFTVDRRDAVADRAVGEAKLLGDLLVGESSGDQAEDLPFAGREVVEPRQCPARPLRMAQIGELLHDGASEPGLIAHDRPDGFDKLRLGPLAAVLAVDADRLGRDEAVERIALL